MNNHAYIVGKKLQTIPNEKLRDILMKHKKEIDNECVKQYKFQEQMLEDLHTWVGCKVCLHCNIDKYPCNGYCNLGGCCGGGTGKIKEDMWEYRGIDYKNANTKEVESIFKDYDKQHSDLMNKLAKGVS